VGGKLTSTPPIGTSLHLDVDRAARIQLQGPLPEGTHSSTKEEVSLPRGTMINNNRNKHAYAGWPAEGPVSPNCQAP
jgi:hypothetical protein